MIATYNGKVVVNPTYNPDNPMAISRRQEQVDEIIANDTRWSDVIASAPGGPNIGLLVYDDGNPITDTILYTDVPGNADSWIVQEPAFYYR